MATIIVVGKNKTREVDLTDACTVVGRDGGASLELGDLQVSRRHALLVRAAEGFFVKDLGSRNGVLVNQKRVPSREQARLKNGDVLSMGRTTLIFKDLTPSGRLTAQKEEAKPTRPVKAAAPAPAKKEGAPAPKAETPKAEAPKPEAPKPEAPKPEKKEPAADTRRPDAVYPPVAAPRRASDRAAPQPLAPAAEIPRALPPNSGVHGRAPSADALVLRALERAERERIFYRNLVLVLTGLVVVTLIVLLLWALSGHRPPAPAAPAPAPAPAAALPAADLSVLDADVFARDVHPVLATKCATCHGTVGKGGGLVLAASDDAGTVAANLSAIRRFVVPGRPAESPLLLKPLPPLEGGPGHGGGEVLAMAQPEWKALSAWVGAVKAAPAAAQPAPAAKPNQAPRAVIAPVAQATVGQPVALDAKGSADPDQDALTYRWSIATQPTGSKAALDRPGEAQCRLVPDAPGTWVVRLVVHDGRAPGSAEVTLAVVAGVDPDRVAAVAKAFEALTGRAPTADEAKELEPLSGARLHEALLRRPEVFARWWDAELEHLGLTGEHRPKNEPWASIPERLRSGRVSVLDVVQAVTMGQAWSQRHQGKDAAVAAVVERLLCLPADAPDAAAIRTAAGRMHDGYEAELLGQKGSSPADLIQIVVKDPRTRTALLARAHRRVAGHDLPAAPLQQAADRLGQDPKQFFPMLAAWASQRVADAR